MLHTGRTGRARVGAQGFLALASAGSLVAGLLAQQRPPGAQTPNTAMGAVSGVVTDAATLRPIAGANVQLGPPPRPGARRLGSAFTDELGRFVFTNVEAGRYYINATRGGYADGHYGPSLNGNGGSSIVLAAGEWFDAADLALVKLSAISGRIVDEHGEPVVGAFVRALASLNVGGAPHLVGGPVATTDDLGEYRIVGLPPGRYFVSVPSIAASVPASSSVADIEGLSADQLAKRDSQTSGPPQRRSRGEVIEGPTAVIVGIYPTPPPVEGHPQAYPTTFYPGTTTLTGATPIDVTTTNDQSRIDVTLAPVPAVSVSGRLGGGSAPYSGIVLRLVPAGLEDLADSSEAATTAAQADGTFTFLRVPAGHYLLTGAPMFGLRWSARATGQSSPQLPDTPGVDGYLQSGGLMATEGLGTVQRSPSPNEARVGFERMPIDVDTDNIRGLVVPVEPPSAIHGEVVFEDVTGPTPIGAFELSPANGAPALGTPIAAVRGTPPTFDFPLVAPGDYELRYRVPPFPIKSITVGGEDRTRQSISVLAGVTTRVLVTVTGKFIKVSGTVRDGKGAAVPAAGIIAFPLDQTLWAHSNFPPPWIGISIASSTGSYQLMTLAAGDYYLVGVDAAHWNAFTDPAFLTSLVPAATRVTLNWGDTRTVDVPFVVKR